MDTKNKSQNTLPRPVLGLGGTARSTFVQTGSRVLVTNFPSLANIIEKRYGDVEEKITTLSGKKLNDQIEITTNSNISSTEKISTLFETQNNLLRQIIDEVKNLNEEDENDDGTRGGRRGKKSSKNIRRRDQVRNRLNRRENFRRIGARAGKAVAQARRVSRETASRLSKTAERIRQSGVSLRERFVNPNQRQPIAPAPETRPTTQVPAPETRPTTQVPAPETRPTAGTGRAAVAAAALGGGFTAATGGNAQQVAGAAASAAAESVAIETTARASEQAIKQRISRSVSERISRVVTAKVPIAGLLVGLFFGVQRAVAGDWVGAGLEVSSGVAGTVGPLTFGLGTGVSLGIDAISLARDVYSVAYEIAPENDPQYNERITVLTRIISEVITDLISSRPRLQPPPRTSATQRRLLEIYNTASTATDPISTAIYDKLKGRSQFLTLNVEGTSPLQRRARAEFDKLLTEIENFISESGASPLPAETTTVPTESEPSTPNNNGSNVNPASVNENSLENIDDFLIRSNNPEVSDQTDAIAADDINNASGENIIDLLSRTEFNEIKIEAEKITFDGNITPNNQNNLTSSALQTPISSNFEGISAPTPQTSVATQTPTATQVESNPASPGLSENDEKTDVTTENNPVSEGDGTDADQTTNTPQSTEIPSDEQKSQETQQQTAEQVSSNLTFNSGVDRRINPELAQKVGSLQSAFGKNFTITSGYRDPQRNERVGGAKNSAHTRKNAVDIQFSGNEQETIRLVQLASQAGFGGIGVYRAGFVHIDTEAKRVWGPDYTSRSIPQWAKESLQAHMEGRTPQTGPALSQEGTAMAAADQAQMRQGTQIVVAQGQQGINPGTQGPIVPSSTHGGEVPLNKRFQNQVAA